MSKKKVKGQQLDLSDMEVGLRAVLPKAPAERAPDDEGRFRRDFGRRDRDEHFDRGGGRSDENWTRGSRAFDDRGGRDGGFDDRGSSRDDGGMWQRGGGRSSGFERGGFERGGFDRGSGGYDDAGSSAGRPRLNLQPRSAPVERKAPASSESSSAPSSDKPVDKWSALDRKWGNSSSSSSSYRGGRDGGGDEWRSGGGVGGGSSGDFRRGGGGGAPRPAGRFAFVENEPREGRRDDRDSYDDRRDDEGYGGSSRGGFGRGGDGGYNRRDYGRGDGGYYERPGSRSQAPPPPPQKTAEERAAEAAVAEEAKRAAEEAKRAAEEEAQRKAEEEARKKEEEARAAEEAARLAEAQQGAAGQLAASGKVGKDLVDLAKSLDCVLGVKATCDAILANVDVSNDTWFTADQYGALLKHMCAGGSSSEKAKKQAEVIYSAQTAFEKIKFPRNDEGEGLIQKLFFALYNEDVVEEEGFQEWRYAEDDDDIPGKLNALTQCNEFLLWLDEPEEEDEDEED